MFNLQGKKFFRSPYAHILIAASLISWGVSSCIWVLVLAGICLFSLTLYGTTVKRSIWMGFLLGALMSLILNHWMVSVVTDYVKGSFLIALLCYFLSALTLGAFFSFQSGLFSYVRNQLANKNLPYLVPFCFAITWVGVELIRAKVFESLPWLSFTTGVSQGDSLYLIQIASIGGVCLMSFFLTLSASYLAEAIMKRSIRPLYASASIIFFELIAGYIIYNHYSVAPPRGIKVAIINPYIDPETVWNQQTAGNLVNRLFSLNQKALASNPDLIVWTETVVPWTYLKNDDFLKEIFSKTSLSNSYSIMGLNSQVDDATINNSIYLFDPNGEVRSRYDKQVLLGLVESSLLDGKSHIILPFMQLSGLTMRLGKNTAPLKTPWGNAGVLICNEATSSFHAKRLIDCGANFFVNMGNDSWFSHTFIPYQHFINCRLRAVETRKDIIVNNNMGYTGIIKSNGGYQLPIQDKETAEGQVTTLDF